MKLRHATLICICALMLCATLHATAQVVNIRDASLRTALAEHLGKEEGAQITSEELATLTEFHADDLGISDLTGLEFAVNLVRIELRHNAISDLAPFASLVALANIKTARQPDIRHLSTRATCQRCVARAGGEQYNRRISPHPFGQSWTGLGWITIQCPTWHLSQG